MGSLLHRALQPCLRPAQIGKCALVVFLFLSGSEFAFAGTSEVASRLYQRLSGVRLPLTGAKRTQMESLINQGRLLEAAQVATAEESFYNITVRQFASQLTTREETTLIPFNDATAMFIGLARDNRDFREILYENFMYIADGSNSEFLASCTQKDCLYHPRDGTNSPGALRHFLAIDKQNHFRFLKRVTPQNYEIKDAAGVLTSYSWQINHLTGGTNRRAVEYAFREFLCTPIKELQDTSVPDFRVRQDVDRSPGGDPSVYQNKCRGCHGQLDALAGAFAYFDNNYVPQLEKVALKYLQNPNVYPAGFVTKDDGWINQFTKNQNASLGWRGPLTGNGVRALGKMLSNSVAFSSCMAKRAFKKVCQRDPLPSEAELIMQLKDGFESSNYNLRQLLERAAILPGCVGN